MSKLKIPSNYKKGIFLNNVWLLSYQVFERKQSLSAICKLGLIYLLYNLMTSNQSTNYLGPFSAVDGLRLVYTFNTQFTKKPEICLFCYMVWLIINKKKEINLKLVGKNLRNWSYVQFLVKLILT